MRYNRDKNMIRDDVDRVRRRTMTASVQHMMMMVMGEAPVASN